MLKEYKNSQYNSIGIQSNTGNAGFHTINCSVFTNTQIQLRCNPSGSPICNWRTAGYISEDALNEILANSDNA